MMNQANGDQTALFTYSVTPDVVLYTTDGKNPSTVTLQISVNNSTGQSQPCMQLIFTVPVGVDNGDLTNNPSSIAANAAQGTGTDWSITSDDEGTFTITPNSAAQLDAGASIAFLLSKVQVNEVAGLVIITVAEYSDGIRSGQASMNKVEPGLAITMFTATPMSVYPGQQATLAWTTTGAMSAVVTWDGNSSPTLGSNGQYVVTPQDTTTYTLAATGGGHTVYQQIMVVVLTVKILSFDAQPAEVAPGGKSTLSWVIANANSAYLEPGHKVVNSKEGTFDVKSDETTTYILKASGYGRTVSMPTVVDVMPVVINSFTSSAPGVFYGEPVTLQWETDWASGCSIDQGVGTVPCSGSIQVTPKQTTTYTLTANGLAPQTKTVTVNVLTTILSFGFTADVNHPDSVVLTWEARAPTVTLQVGGGPPRPVKASDSLAISMGSNRTLVTLTAGANENVVQSTLEFLEGNPVTSYGAITQLAAMGDNGITTPNVDITLSWNVPLNPQGGAVGDFFTADGGWVTLYLSEGRLVRNTLGASYYSWLWECALITGDRAGKGVHVRLKGFANRPSVHGGGLQDSEAGELPAGGDHLGKPSSD